MNNIEIYSSINKVVLGLKYKSFKVPDISGEIVDEILYDKESPFNPEFFPYTTSIVNGKVLENDEKGHSLHIDTENFIFTLSLDNVGKEDINKLQTVYASFFVKLLSKYRINNIQRLGIIFIHELDLNAKLDTFLSDFTNNKLSEFNEANITFAKKIPAPQAVVKQGIEDYYNAIFVFSKKKSRTIVNLDYQKYLQPQAENIKEADLIEFIAKAKDYLSDNFYDWLKTYGREK